MTFVNFAMGTACLAGLALMAYAGSGGAWLNARLMDNGRITPLPSTVVFATMPAEALISTTERVELTRSPFVEFNPNGNGTERVQARLEQARAANARNQVRSSRTPTEGARRQANARTRTAKASQAGRSTKGRTSVARGSRRVDENRLPRRGSSSTRSRHYRNPRYIGRSH